LAEVSKVLEKFRNRRLVSATFWQCQY